MRRARFWSTVAGSLAVIALLARGAPAGAAPAPPSGGLAAAFATAAQRYGVPQALLMSISFVETRWQATYHHAWSDVDSTEAPVDGPSTFGPMALFDLGNNQGTVQQAAADLGVSVAQVETDPATNILGAAAVLADAARMINAGKQPPSGNVNAWYGAAAKFIGINSFEPTKQFADQVFTTIQNGVQAMASDGETLTIQAQAVNPDTSQINVLNLTHLLPQQSDYPLADAFIPAGGSGRAGANRPKDLFIQYIVIHDTEASYPDTVRAFTVHNCCSAHYVVDGADADNGVFPAVTQFVFNHDIAFHAGNFWFNQHSIGIENIGHADNPNGFYTLRDYTNLAKLVGFLAAVYNIPIDRAHIISHANVPPPTPFFTHGMHWDPGPFWDWPFFLRAARAAYASWTNGAPLPTSTIVPTLDTPNAGVRVVNANDQFAAASDIPTWETQGHVEFTPVFADSAGVPAASLVLGASDPSTWTSPTTFDARDFSCDNLPDPVPNLDGTLTEDTSSDQRAKADCGGAFAVLDTFTDASGARWDKVDFNGVAGWIRDADTSGAAGGAGVVVTFRGGSTPTTLFGKPILSSTFAICPDAANGFSRAGQSYVAQVRFVDATGALWYQIAYNHRLAWVPAAEVSVR